MGGFTRWLVPCWLLVVVGWGSAAGAGGVAPVKGFRISGVVVSTRDGSPVRRCRMMATQARQAGSGSGGAGVAGEGRRAGGGPDGPRGGDGGAAEQQPEAVETDGRGRFSMSVPRGGIWRLTGTARGFRTQGYEEHEAFFEGIVLTAAAPEMAVTFKMTPDGVISGTVYDEAGEAVRNGQVQAEAVIAPTENARARNGVQRGAVQTDDRGHYEISGLAPGPYRLKVTARPWYATVARGGTAGYAPGAPLDPSLDVAYAETWFPAALDESGAETIQLSGGEEREADFHLVAIASVHLKIPRLQTPERTPDGNPVRGSAPPLVQGAGGRFFAQGTVTTSSATEWDVGGLAPGSYQVRLPGPGGGGQEVPMITVKIGRGTSGAVDLSAVESGSLVTVTCDGVQASAVREVTLVDFATGQSYGAEGPRGGRKRDDEEPKSVERVVTVPPGRYQVFLNGAPGLYLTGMTATGGTVAGRSVMVAGSPVKLVVHAALGVGEVDGVAKRDGKAVAGGMVLLVPAGWGQPENVTPVLRRETNTDGSFTLMGVTPGRYILVAIEKGWGVNWRDAGTLLGYLGRGVALEVKDGGVVREVVESW